MRLLKGLVIAWGWFLCHAIYTPLQMVVAALEGDELVDSYNRSRLLSIKRFLELLPVTEVIEAADITLAKWKSTTKDRAFKYFCAVCWDKIRGTNNGQNQNS